MIPRGYTFNGFRTFGDGGAPGYSGNVYVSSKIEEDELKSTDLNANDAQKTVELETKKKKKTKIKKKSRIIASKSKVSKQTVPANEVLSKPNQMDLTKEVVKSLDHREEIMNAQVDIIAAGDSVCTACPFNPNIEIRNVLMKSAI